MAHLENDRGRGSPELTSYPVNQQTSRRFLKVGPWLPLLIVCAGLILWEVSVRQGWISPLYFPAPTEIVETMFDPDTRGELVEDMMATLSRMFSGLLLGGLTGLFFGLIMGWSSRLRTVVEPFVAAIHPLPKIALLPLIMVIFGIGNTSFVIVIALGAFFPLLINTMVGVIQIPSLYFEVAANYRASRWRVFKRVVWPGARPMILAGLRLSLNVTLLLAVAVEMVGSPNGLGNMIWMAWGTMRVEDIYISLTIIVILGLIINVLLNRFIMRAIPWQHLQSD